MPSTTFRRGIPAMIATGALLGARRAMTRRADRRFLSVDPKTFTVHEVGSDRFRLPAAFHRSDGLVAYVTADLTAAAALMPSPTLFPVRVGRGRALAGVFAARHLEVTATDPDGSMRALMPYGEVGIFLAATTTPMPPILPMLLELGLDQPMGMVILQLPVTSRAARDSGRLVWGMPKFLADMTFSESGDRRSVEVSDGGRSVVSLDLEVSGNARLSRAPTLIFSVLDGRLIRTVSPSRAFVQIGVRPDGLLTLGDHPVARALDELDLGTRPIVAGIVQQQRFLLPAGRDVGPATAIPWFDGSSAPCARFVTRHEDGTVVDHAPVPTAVEPGRPAERIVHSS